ncbi:uncharacterized protein LOC101862000 [Aplysia californica]|uniref:Uncharacterized protein LOC101862000 n=1 Tax=Aplysia californica TaxID=6500 RepID=A0ABM1W331_APLCA|nr:uncharacterized protein LOC101862000 [Aplysia californica]
MDRDAVEAAGVPTLKSIARVRLSQWVVADRHAGHATRRGCDRLLAQLDQGSWGLESEAILARVVDFFSLRLTDETLTALVPPQVRTLSLSNSPLVTAVCLNQLIHKCTHLQSLDLSDNTELTFNLVQLFASPVTCRHTHLTSVSLEDCITVTDTHVQCLLTSAPNLQQLSLAHCDITDAVFLLDETKQLTRETGVQLPTAQSAYDSQLQCVDVSRCNTFTSTGLRHLCTLCGPTLRSVNLCWTKVDCTSLLYLSGYGLPAAVQLYLACDFLPKGMLDSLLATLEEFQAIVAPLRDCWLTRGSMNDHRPPGHADDSHINDGDTDPLVFMSTGSNDLQSGPEAQVALKNDVDPHSELQDLSLITMVTGAAASSAEASSSHVSNDILSPSDIVVAVADVDVTSDTASAPSSCDIVADAVSSPAAVTTQDVATDSTETLQHVVSARTVSVQLVATDNAVTAQQPVVNDTTLTAQHTLTDNTVTAQLCALTDNEVITENNASALTPCPSHVMPSHARPNSDVEDSSVLCATESEARTPDFDQLYSCQTDSHVMERQAASDADTPTDSETGKQMVLDTDRQTTSYTNRLTKSDTNRQATSNTDRQTTSDADAQTNSDKNRPINSNANRQTTSHRDREIISDRDRQTISDTDRQAPSGTDAKMTLNTDKQTTSDRNKETPDTNGQTTSDSYSHERFFQPALREVSVNGSVFKDELIGLHCLRHFLSSNPTLASLRLYGGTSCNFVSDNVLAPIGQHAGDVTSVCLQGCDRVTDLGLWSLTLCKKLNQVDFTGLAFIQDPGLLQLVTARPMTSLQLAESQISNFALKIMSTQPLVHTLQELDLSWCEEIEEDTELNQLLSACKVLRQLRLRACPLSARCLELIAENCTQLTELSIASNMNTVLDESVIHLSEHLPLLEIIDLGWNTHLSNTAIHSLMRNCRRLTTVHLEGLKQITSRPFLNIIAVPDCLMSYLEKIQQLAGELGTGTWDLQMSELPALPHRSTVYCSRLRELFLNYSDLVEDHRLEEIVAVAQGSLKVINYYGEPVEEVAGAVPRFLNNLVGGTAGR